MDNQLDLIYLARNNFVTEFLIRLAIKQKITERELKQLIELETPLLYFLRFIPIITLPEQAVLTLLKNKPIYCKLFTPYLKNRHLKWLDNSKKTVQYLIITKKRKLKNELIIEDEELYHRYRYYSGLEECSNPEWCNILPYLNLDLEIPTTLEYKILLNCKLTSDIVSYKKYRNFVSKIPDNIAKEILSDPAFLLYELDLLFNGRIIYNSDIISHSILKIFSVDLYSLIDKEANYEKVKANILISLLMQLIDDEHTIHLLTVALNQYNIRWKKRIYGIEINIACTLIEMYFNKDIGLKEMLSDCRSKYQI